MAEAAPALPLLLTLVTALEVWLVRERHAETKILAPPSILHVKPGGASVIESRKAGGQKRHV